jgi:hypothetical protein
VNKATPTDTLGSSVNPVLAQTSVTFTATVSSPVSTPSGSVRFYDGTTLLGSATLAQGVATYATSSLTVGNHSITAAYGGDSNFLAVTSSPVTETVEDFTVTVPTGDPTSATVSPGGTANYIVHVAPSNAQTFLSAIAMTVSGTPAGATATFTPSSLAAGAGAQDVALKVVVASQTAPIHSSGVLLKLSPVMAGMLLLPFGGKIRRAAGNRRRTVRLLLLFLATASLAGIMACGGNSTSTGSQPPTYTLTVAGTSGTLSHSTTLTLTVQ